MFSEYCASSPFGHAITDQFLEKIPTRSKQYPYDVLRSQNNLCTMSAIKITSTTRI
jgi:hypothetical protein